MGDMADAICNGDFDEVTGEWLGNGQGFPRSLTRQNGRQNTEHFNSATFGVQKVTKQYVKKKQHNVFILNYGRDQLGIKSSQIDEICAKIQENFNAYMIYLKNNKPK